MGCRILGFGFWFGDLGDECDEVGGVVAFVGGVFGGGDGAYFVLVVEDDAADAFAGEACGAAEVCDVGVCFECGGWGGGGGGEDGVDEGVYFVE